MYESSEKKLTLLLLCWFFGLFGVHRFYAGKGVTGSIQLGALILMGVFAIFDIGIVSAVLVVGLFVWTLVDTALIIMGRFTDRNGLHIVQWV